jgi:hypothetical protein
MPKKAKKNVSKRTNRFNLSDRTRLLLIIAAIVSFCVTSYIILTG